MTDLLVKGAVSPDIVKRPMLRLTVAIPTYNRNAELAAQLSRLVPQLDASTELIVLDNHSDRPIYDEIAPLFGAQPVFRYRTVRHVTNIGPNANILRSVELAAGEWLWVLSDDDPVLPNAVTTILETIRAAELKIRYINFSSDDFARERDFRTIGVKGLATGLDHFGHTILLSSGIYRTESVRAALRDAYDFAYSCCPQFVLLLQSLGEDGVCLWRRDCIVSWAMPPLEGQWNALRLVVRMPCVLDHRSLDYVSRAALAQKLQLILPRAAVLWLVLLVRVRGGMPKADAIMMFHEYAARHASVRFNRWERMALGCGLWSFSAGVFLLPVLLAIYRKLRGRPFEDPAATLPLENRI
jgi:hypothetical protein